MPNAMALSRHKSSFTFFIAIIDPFQCKSFQILELLPYFKPLIFFMAAMLICKSLFAGIKLLLCTTASILSIITLAVI